MSNYDSYNKIIDQYMEQSEVNSALLLTAPWGSGKSYYIENVLKKHMEENNKDIINISLYGVCSLGEITNIILNRAVLYCKAIKDIGKSNVVTDLKKLRENSPYAKIITSKASLFLSGLVNKFADAFNLSEPDEDVKNLFELIDSKKLLVVLEDAERTNINIADLLGYINNLVDCANMKILLVANENIFLKRKNSSTERRLIIKDKQKDEEKDIEVEKYKEYKEKTISDTIRFQAMRDETIKNILFHFDKTYVLKNNKFMNLFDMITKTMDGHTCYNYRTLKFALQKVVDYFGDSINTRDGRFFYAVAYSILRFSIQIRENRESDGFEESSILGISSLKQYVEGDISVTTHIDDFEKSYIEYINKYEKDSNATKLIKQLEMWFELPQAELEDLILEVANAIKTDKISCEYYKDIMYFILLSKDLVDIDKEIDECKLICLNKLKDKSTDVDCINTDFGYDLSIVNGDTRYDEYKQFVAEIKTIISSRKNQSIEQAMLYDNLEKFCTVIRNKEKEIHSMHEFMSKIDVNKLADLIIKSEPKQIQSFRRVLKTIYNVVNIKDVYPNDYNNVELLYNRINSKNKNVKDKVAKFILKFLSDELFNYLELLK